MWLWGRLGAALVERIASGAASQAHGAARFVVLAEFRSHGLEQVARLLFTASSRRWGSGPFR